MQSWPHLSTRLVHRIVHAFALVALAQTAVEAADITVGWDYTASGASGFMLHCGSATGSYTSRFDAGNADRYTLKSLAAGSTTYCVVAAYDPAKLEGVYSNELKIAVPASGPAPIIIDNGQVGASFTGSWCKSAALSPYGASSLYSCGGGSDTYRWTPTIPTAGNYDVYVWWTSHANRSTSVPITVVANGITQTFIKNERVGGGQWQFLGTFAFAVGKSGYVQVSDRSGQAAADAVRWVKH
jgi:hypothetical protein